MQTTHRAAALCSLVPMVPFRRWSYRPSIQQPAIQDLNMTSNSHSLVPSPQQQQQHRRCKLQKLVALPGSSRSTGSSSASLKEVFCFELGCVAADTARVLTGCAWLAARAVWPDKMVGTASVYERSMHTVLQATRQPHEAVVLIRLLCEEGIVGARSTAGRAGPVVGRAIRQTGSRPLLLAEVLEHWELVQETCLTRWSLEQGCSRAELQVRIRHAYLDAEQAFAAAGSGGGREDSMDGKGDEAAAASSSSSSSSRINPLVAGCRTAVQAINQSSGLVYIASAHRHKLSKRLQAGSGLKSEGVTLVKAPSLQGAVGHVVQLQDAGDVVHVVVDSPSKAQRLLREMGEVVAGARQVQVQVHVAEWTCTAPSLRAKALCHDGIRLLAEHQLAQLLGVAHIREVMDGIAWR